MLAKLKPSLFGRGGGIPIMLHFLNRVSSVFLHVFLLGAPVFSYIEKARKLLYALPNCELIRVHV